MRMRNAWVGLLLVACGNDGKDGKSIDAAPPPPDGRVVDTPPAQAMITISGTAVEQTTNGQLDLAGVTIKAFRSSDETTPVATTTSDAQGNYTITLVTNGEALDGYLSATKADYVDTFLYPPYPVFEDFDMASVIMVSPANYDNLSTLTGANQQPGKGLVALVVTDGTTAVAGATVSSTPAASAYKYNAEVGAFVLPSGVATETYTDGVAYMFNLPPGGVTVSAQKTGMTFEAHPVNARADVLTTTLITP